MGHRQKWALLPLRFKFRLLLLLLLVVAAAASSIGRRFHLPVLLCGCSSVASQSRRIYYIAFAQFFLFFLPLPTLPSPTLLSLSFTVYLIPGLLTEKLAQCAAWHAKQAFSCCFLFSVLPSLFFSFSARRFFSPFAFCFCCCHCQLATRLPRFTGRGRPDPLSFLPQPPSLPPLVAVAFWSA